MEILLIAIIVLLAALLIQREYHHRQLSRLLNDLATMIGELFDVLKK